MAPPSLPCWPRKPPLEPRRKHLKQAATVHYHITTRLYTLKHHLSFLLASSSSSSSSTAAAVVEEAEGKGGRYTHADLLEMHHHTALLLRLHLRGINNNPDGTYWYDTLRQWRARSEAGLDTPDAEVGILRALLEFWGDADGRRREWAWLPDGQAEEAVVLGGDVKMELRRRVWRGCEEVGWRCFESKREGVRKWAVEEGWVAE